MAHNGWGLSRAFAVVTGRLRGRMDLLPTRQPAPLRAYVARKRSLPHNFGEGDWLRALEYWGYKCAVCGRPRGLWHTLAADHWVPLTAPGCPGTVPTNIVPLCHGEGGCNNTKRAKMPDEWLAAKLGQKAAFQKQLEIDAYFLWVKDQLTDRLGCWNCGEPVLYSAEDDLWLCTYCDAEWGNAEARMFQRCPRCQCWMIEIDGLCTCPRCRIDWSAAILPAQERCPGCGDGLLEWEYEADGPACGWWRCTACGGEWVFEWT